MKKRPTRLEPMSTVETFAVREKGLLTATADQE